MNDRKVCLLVTAAGLLIAVPAQAQKSVHFDGTPPSGPDAIPDHYICIFSDASVPRANVRAEAARSAAQAGGQIGHVYTHAGRGFSIRATREGLARMIAKSPQIANCEQEGLATVPKPVEGTARPTKPGGGGGGTSGEKIDWGVAFVGGPGDGTGKTAWVIDSGIDLDHPDLAVDVGRSQSFLSSTTSPDDQYGHGTHVAGIIAARHNNGIGTAGVAAGATVVSYRVLDRRGSGPDSGVLAALDAAYQNASKGDVVNLSLITAKMETMNSFVQNLGARPEGDGGPVFVVSAAGNSSTDASGYSPASAEGVNVYTTSAIADTAGTWAFYSNFGNSSDGRPIDYAEPGSSIYSLDKNGGYTTKSGTSMAAPHLAGILLLNGLIRTSSVVVQGDPDGTTDPIGVR